MAQTLLLRRTSDRLQIDKEVGNVNTGSCCGGGWVANERRGVRSKLFTERKPAARSFVSAHATLLPFRRTCGVYCSCCSSACAASRPRRRLLLLLCCVAMRMQQLNMVDSRVLPVENNTDARQR